MEHIYPIFDEILDRKSKENRLQQKGKVIWLIGLSGSGKSTIAKTIEKKLFQEGFITQLLDGDNFRFGLNGDLTFSTKDRVENLRRTAEVAKLFKESGFVTFCSFITPTEESRHKAQAIIGSDDYIEVYIDCPLEVCEERDVKGLYKKARAGEIPDFTGISSPFEKPKNAAISLKSGSKSLDECVEELYQFIFPLISYK
ncbi:MAG: adenylyl-sulfate kinase [Bacteroidia bacterium]